MKSLQERMDGMKPYFRAIEVYNDALMVRVVLPSSWKIYPSADGRIKVTPSETNANEAIYYADGNEATYEDIFDLVEETIKAVKDAAPDCRVMVGGAVLTEDYAKSIGADYYCKDAMKSVEAAQQVFGGDK